MQHIYYWLLYVILYFLFFQVQLIRQSRCGRQGLVKWPLQVTVTVSEVLQCSQLWSSCPALMIGIQSSLTDSCFQIPEIVTFRIQLYLHSWPPLHNARTLCLGHTCARHFVPSTSINTSLQWPPVYYGQLILRKGCSRSEIPHTEKKSCY